MNFYRVYSRSFYADDRGQLHFLNERFVGYSKGSIYQDALRLALKDWPWAVNTEPLLYSISPADIAAIKEAQEALSKRRNENAELKAWLRSPAFVSTNAKGA